MSVWVRSKNPAWSSGSGFVAEELDLGAGVEAEALLPGAVEVALQHEARVTLERVAREVLHVAEHARRGRVLAAPRHDVEGVGVGHREHVRLLDPAVALDGRAVEAHALLERPLELRRRDREALERAQHVGEPEADEPHPPFLDGAHHVVELAFHPSSLTARWRGDSGRPVPFTLRSHKGNGRETAAWLGAACTALPASARLRSHIFGRTRG
jgi:hypothetical protein